MRRRRVSFSSDSRWTPLKRAGLAVTAALILLLAVLWFGDGDRTPRPLPESANDALTQFDEPKLDVPAPEFDTTTIEPPVFVAEETAVTPEAGESEPQAVASSDPLNALDASAANSPTAGEAPAPPPKAVGPSVKSSKAVDTPAKPSKALDTPAKPISLPDGYFVQLGVFDDTDNAGKLFENAVALGMPAHIQSRVVVGPFRNKREAEAARNRLKNIAEGVVLPPQKTAKAGENPKAKSRRRAK
ncbi:MAG: SPOR domain-containing protein [Betaproteobacteria bacterium]|nr:SPOR domain-containing protein [Betaproteobacteria bacterium]